MLRGQEWSTGIQVPFEADKIGHRGHCVVQYDVHISRVYLGDDVLPVGEGTKVAVEEGKVDGRIAYGGTV